MVRKSYGYLLFILLVGGGIFACHPEDAGLLLREDFSSLPGC